MKERKRWEGNAWRRKEKRKTGWNEINKMQKLYVTCLSLYIVNVIHLNDFCIIIFNRDAVLDLLICKVGLLIPSPATLKEFATYWSDMTKHLTENVSMDLPKEALSMWSPLFKAWHKGNGTFLSKLVTTLIKRVHEFERNSENMLLIRYFACWVHFILFNSGSPNKSENQWKIKANLDYITILEVTLRNCSSYTPLFLPFIINNLQHLPDRLKQKLEKLRTVLALGKSNDSVSLKFVGSSTVEETVSVCDKLAKSFPQLADRVKLRLKQQTGLKNHASWQPCGPSFSRSVPLGCLIGAEPMQFQLLDFPEELDSMQVEEYAVEEVSSESTKDDGMVSGHTCDVTGHAGEVSGNLVVNDSENERLSDMQCETSTHDNRSAIESISQQIWIF